MLALAITSAAPVPELEPGWPSSFNLSFSFGAGAYPGLLYHIAPKTTSPEIYVWALDGEEEAGWPKVWRIQGKSLEEFRLFPVWDFDGDGVPEMLALKDTFWVLVELPSGNIEVVKKHWGDAYFFWSPPALFDANVDGAPEVFWIEGYDVNASEALKEVRLYRFSGNRIDSSIFYAPRGIDLNKIIVNSFSVRVPLGDLDGDGQAELALLLPDTDSTTTLILVNAEVLEPEGSISVKGEIYLWPVVADIDKDGGSEAIFVTHLGNDFCIVHIVSLSRLVVLSERSFPMEMFFSGVWNPLLLADVDGDGSPEILFLWESNVNYQGYSATLHIDVYDASLNLIKKDSFAIRGNLEAFCVSGDLDGDGTDDLLVSAPLIEDGIALSGYSVLKGTLWQLNIPPDTSIEGLAVVMNDVVYPFLWDVDGDGCPEFPAARLFLNMDTQVGPAFLSLFEIPIQNPHLGWPMLYHDPWNTNNYDFWPPQVGVGESSGKVQGSLTLRPTLKGLLVRSSKSQKLPLKVYDPAGRLLYKAELTLKPGDNLVEIPGKGVRLVMVGKAKVKVVGR